MMYRAMVEAVSGLKVRAGGKWMTCIGNRTVKAGDMIWTDGRCVYGHDREAQTPLVIANPAKDKLYIPISTNPVADLLSSWGKGQRYLYTDKLNFIDESFDDESGYHSYTYGKCVTAGRHAVYFEWYRRGFFEGTQVIWTPAINVDKEENIYTLSYKTNRVSDPQGRVDRGYYLSIDIKKNGQTISSSSTATERENVVSETYSLAAQEFYSGSYVTQYLEPRTRIIVGRRYNIAGEDIWQYHEDFDDEIGPRLAREGTTIVMESVGNFTYIYPMYDFNERHPSVDTNVLWAFIENENNWAIIVECRGLSKITTSKPAELSDPISKHYLNYMTSYWIDDPITVDIEAITSSTYLITNKGSKLLAEATELDVSHPIIYESPECAVVREMAGLPPLSYGSLGNGERRSSKTSTISGYEGLVLPMQDGFYYKVHKAIVLDRGDAPSRPALIDVTVYSPSGKAIFSGIFFSDSYLAAYKIKSNKYLISVRTLEKATPYYAEEWDKYKTVVVRRGLYLCRVTNENGTLEKISSRVIENQCLRSSEFFKKWDGTLQRIPQGGEESE